METSQSSQMDVLVFVVKVMASRAQEEALRNPIILRKILAQKSAPLKNCRLVCHFWNDMVLSLPKTRLVLNLNNEKYEDDAVPFFDLCYNLNDRLARRISSKNRTGASSVLFAVKLMHLCDKFTHLVQISEIRINHEACLPSIFKVLKNSCQNLKQLRIRCDFRDDGNVFPGILVEELPRKPNLTVFQLHSEVVAVSPTLASFAQLVVSASPNLRKVKLPWGIYPDLATSKFLDSLTLELDDARPLDIALRQFNPPELNRMLWQVGEQLVYLAFSYSLKNDGKSMKEDAHNLDLSTPSEFRLWGNMSKLRTFENEMIDIIRHTDLWQDIEERMPALGSLRIGKISKNVTSVDAVLKKLPETKRIFPKVTNLKINELYDPKLLDGVKTAFPSLEILALVSVHKAGMELGRVLKACAGFDELTSLLLWLPAYPERTKDLVKALLKGSDLYEELNILEILMHKRENKRRNLTESETHLFKGLLVAMKEMERVVIDNLHFGDECRRSMLDFMQSNGMPVSKFRIF